MAFERPLEVEIERVTCPKTREEGGERGGREREEGSRAGGREGREGKEQGVTRLVTSYTAATKQL